MIARSPTAAFGAENSEAEKLYSNVAVKKRSDVIPSTGRSPARQKRETLLQGLQNSPTNQVQAAYYLYVVCKQPPWMMVHTATNGGAWDDRVDRNFLRALLVRTRQSPLTL